ncbi:ankyrin repeat domain-containing protein [Candidatus Dependentiae bacterium]|nr:ankyrin repeat domain-containing protein [Candidatus Dependentiae bacterium]
MEKHVDLNAVDSDGWTALMYAVTVGDAVCVAKLIEAGADASIKNNDGDTAMALCKQSKKRYNLIQIIDPKEPLPDITE